MKLIFSTGIGDAFCLDCLFTQDFRESITEIYWACKYGQPLSYVFKNNFFYKNLKQQYFLKENDVKNFFESKFGKEYQHHSNPHVCKFWHFKDDPSDWNHRDGYELAHQVFGLNEKIKFLNASAILKQKQTFNGSSFLNNANLNDFDWDKYNIFPNEYILVHQSSDNRPKSDISSINEEDWQIIDKISIEQNKKVVIITDQNELKVPLKNYLIINVFNLPLEKSLINICALCKYSYYYIGLDSYVGILCAKILNPEKLYIKSYDKNIYSTLENHTLLQNFFLPHNTKTIQKFYLYQKKIDNES